VFPDPKEILDELHRQHFHAVSTRHSVGQASWTVHDPCNVSRLIAVDKLLLDTPRKDFAMGSMDGGRMKAIRSTSRRALVRNRMYWEGPQLDRANERSLCVGTATVTPACSGMLRSVVGDVIPHGKR